MHFFINKALGNSNSGVEHAQFNRARYFKQRNLSFKYVFTAFLPNMHQYMSKWKIAEKEVIGLYDYFLSDDPDEYLEKGNLVVSTFNEQKLLDTNGTTRVIMQQTSGNYSARVYKHESYDAQGNQKISHTSRVILTSAKRCMQWQNKNTPLGQKMVDIHLDNFRGKNYYFATFEELLRFFYQELEHHFQNNQYFIDRGDENEEVLLSLKSSYDFKIIIIIHAEHFVGQLGTYNVWNNHYQYLFNHVEDIDCIVVSTALQKHDIIHQLAMNEETLNQKIIVIPVGGIKKIAPIQHFDGGVMKFVTASRLHKEKNIKHIIFAIDKLRASGYLATLDIYGTGDEFINLKNVIADRNLNDIVALKGHNSQISNVLQKYHAFVSASYSEGFGLTYVEAIESGLPIISYANKYGAQTLIDSGQNGILVPITMNDSENISQLTQAMMHIYNCYDTLAIGNKKIPLTLEEKYIADKWQELIGGLI